MKNFSKFALIIFLGIALLFVLQKNSFAIIYSINAAMSGAQENPPVAGGSGTFTGTYNSVTKILSYNIVFSVTGTITAGHFHGPAAVGVNAGVQQGFIGLPLGVTNGNFTSASTALTATQETQLLNGLWYTNLHTTTFGGGAIRGQLFPVALHTLDLTYLIEGLYNGTSMVRDTVTVNLRENFSPFAMVSSSKVFLSTAGTATINFANATNSTQYYIQILNRNAIEEYSGEPFSFAANSGSYDFSSSASRSLGNNLILVGSKYCSYSGDVNQNGFIDLSDIIDVSNDADLFLTGYVATDLNGNNIVNLEDILICYNNAIKFISAQVPSSGR
ncbi:MAG: CHRD domain-containing protein [Ignavibacteria bacterium]|nr:CHRD domain-containing protein [Ignavibacteria bacterium]